jgi:hypothetical protein
MARWPAPNPKASNQESQALKQRYSSDHFVEEATEGLSKNGHSTHPNPKDPTHTSKQNQNSKQDTILRAKNRKEINPDQNQIADAQTKKINAGKCGEHTTQRLPGRALLRGGGTQREQQQH